MFQMFGRFSTGNIDRKWVWAIHPRGSALSKALYPLSGVLVYMVGGPALPGWHAFMFYLAALNITQTPVAFLKYTTSRRRPCVALKDELVNVKRSLPLMKSHLMKGPAAVESFPSGDAAGAAVFLLRCVKISIAINQCWIKFNV